MCQIPVLSASHGLLAFIPHDSSTEICMLVFYISQLGRLQCGEVNSFAQDYTAREAWRPGSEPVLSTTATRWFAHQPLLFFFSKLLRLNF